MGEPDVGLRRGHQRPELSQVVRPRRRFVGEWLPDVGVDGDDPTTDLFDEAGREPRARSVAAVDGDLQPGLLDRVGVNALGECPQMVVRHILGGLHHRTDLLVIGLGELALVEDVQQFLALVGVQVQPVVPDELQGVPFHRIVSGRHRDAP
jgi:hypothetical protein